MKRSTAISLLALGAGAVLIQSQFGSTDGDSEGQPDTGTVFTSKSQCASAGVVDKVDCDKGWDDALKAHEASAPHYSNMADCEKVYGEGKCSAPSTFTGSPATYVIPAMMGYMVGRTWSRSGCRAAPLFRRPADPKDQYQFTVPGSCTAPFASSSGTTTSFSGHYYGGGGGGSRSTTYTRSSTTRGGFGSTGRGFSGFSGA